MSKFPSRGTGGGLDTQEVRFTHSYTGTNTKHWPSLLCTGPVTFSLLQPNNSFCLDSRKKTQISSGHYRGCAAIRVLKYKFVGTNMYLQCKREKYPLTLIGSKASTWGHWTYFWTEYWQSSYKGLVKNGKIGCSIN